MDGELAQKLHHCILRFFEISSWPRNQNYLIKQAHSLQFVQSSLPINISSLLHIIHTKATSILVFSFSLSYLGFSKVLWQEESGSSNQSFSFETKHSNISRRSIRSDPSTWNTSVSSRTSSSLSIWSKV